MIDCPGNNASVLKDSLATGHCVGLASSCHSVAHHSTIVSLDDRLYDIICRCLVSFILTGVVKKLFKVERPSIGLIIDDTGVCIFFESHFDRPLSRVDVDVLLREICGGSRADDDLDSLALSRHIQIKLNLK